MHLTRGAEGMTKALSAHFGIDDESQTRPERVAVTEARLDAGIRLLERRDDLAHTASGDGHDLPTVS
jgi:hypothetical protein